MKGTIPINPTSIKKYLDKCIRFWRNKLKNSKTKEDKLIAECNIDTFQSVRVSLFGKLLQNEEKKVRRFICFLKGCRFGENSFSLFCPRCLNTPKTAYIYDYNIIKRITKKFIYRDKYIRII